MGTDDNSYLQLSDALSQWFSEKDYVELSDEECLFLPEPEIELLSQWEINPYLITIQAIATQNAALGIGDISIDATTRPKAVEEIKGHLVFFMNSLFNNVFIEDVNKVLHKQIFSRGMFAIVTDDMRKAQEWHYWLAEQTPHIEYMLQIHNQCSYRSAIQTSDTMNCCITYIEVTKTSALQAEPVMPLTPLN